MHRCGGDRAAGARHDHRVCRWSVCAGGAQHPAPAGLPHLENIGIILLGLGAGVTGIALEQPALIALGTVGGLYHLLNHSLFKSVLFLGAGSVWFRTGHRDIEKLGGIGKKMPVISIAMLVGLMAMAALPPLNGFAGEWVIYQSFFKLSNSGAFVARLLGPLLAVGLAITGALAVMCMAKVYGVTFLGAPRTKEAENATVRRS